MAEFQIQRPDPSIAGPKTIISWVMILGSYLIGAIATVGALVAVVDWYKVPPGSEPMRVRLVTSAIVIVLCVSAIAFLLHMTFDYRRRFRLHRDRGLIRDLYPTRDR